MLKRVFLLSILAVVMGGCSQASIDIPGGAMDVSIFYWQDTVPDVVVAFDPDTAIMSGNETLVRVSLDNYWDGNGNVAQFFTWSSAESGLEHGDYFVYAFIDVDSDAAYTQTDSNGSSSIILYDPVYRYAANIQTMQIEFAPNNFDGLLLPNYSYTQFFAPQINFSFNVNVG